MQQIVDPHEIIYTGKLADKHVINSEDFGRSMLGASKISTAVIHYVFSGKVPKGNYTKEFQCVTKPAVAGSFEWMQIVVPIAPLLVEHSPELMSGASFLFRTFWTAIIGVLAGKKVDNVKTMADLILGLKQQDNAAFLEALRIQAGVSDSGYAAVVDVVARQALLTEKLIENSFRNVNELARTQKTNAINFVQPIGNSCTTINNHFYPNSSVVIDPPAAEVIRSSELDEIGVESLFHCKKITELNIKTGHCILSVDGLDGDIKGQISDPALQRAQNVYSVALNDHSQLGLVGKPIIRDGEIIKIHVSDARKI